jgi:hypothetical protein
VKRAFGVWIRRLKKKKTERWSLRERRIFSGNPSPSRKSLLILGKV